MSPEEWQVVVGEWQSKLGAVSDEIWDMRKEEMEPEHVDTLAGVVNVLSKVLRDMGAVAWSDADRDHAFTVVAGYVTQSNVERQQRRDADLAKHKKMIGKDAENQIIAGLRDASLRTAEAERRAELAERKIETEIAKHKTLLDDEQLQWAVNQKTQFDAAVRDEVERRLMGGTVSATPGRTKRPVIIG